jgi:hypothetical protein
MASDPAAAGPCLLEAGSDRFTPALAPGGLLRTVASANPTGFDDVQEVS